MADERFAASIDSPKDIASQEIGASDRAREPKWVVFDSSEAFGGHQEMTARILQVLVKSGSRRVLYFLPEGALRTASRMKEIQPRLELHGHGIGPRRFSWSKPGQWTAWARLLRNIADVAPDRLIIVAGGLEEAWRGAAIGRLLGIATTVYLPSVRTMASVGAKLGVFRDRLALWAIGRKARLVVISPRQREELVARGLDPSRVGVLENFMDAPAPRSSTGSESTPRRPSVGIVGRVDLHAKGLDILLALAEIGAGKYDYHVVGDGPDLDALRSRIRGTSISERCFFHGWQDPWAVPFDVLLLPSRMEGVPLVAVEAVLRGIPVLAADLPETRDLLPSNWLFDRTDPAGLENKLDRLCARDSARQIADLRGEFLARFVRDPPSRSIASIFEGGPDEC